MPRSTQVEDGKGAASAERRAVDIPAEQVCGRAGGGAGGGSRRVRYSSERYCGKD